MITAAAGNHVLALAYYGIKLGVPVTVVLPTSAPQVKASILGSNMSAMHVHWKKLEVTKMGYLSCRNYTTPHFYHSVG